MDNDETIILREQLKEKDKQIAELQSIIRNLTQDEDEEKADADNENKPESSKRGFWQRHAALSYIMLCAVVILAITIILSPWLFPSFWQEHGKWAQLGYTYAVIGSFAGILLAWTHTPRGRKWLNEL